jgi:uncharacterized repeat protein (TIGR01451 family)
VKFYLFTSTHVAAHFQGIILDDFTGEFDPFSPQFGEKFAPAYLPVGIKDWTGNEVNRVYSDQFGLYNGLNYSTWEVNPPNPTGYGPTMMVYCMNDAGMKNDATGKSTPDALFQPGYSQFCYELPGMPGQTGYFDTPVVPVQAFSEGYNHPDCAYPDATPGILSVVNSSSSEPQGPWVTPAIAAASATTSFSISAVARCTTASCANPSSITFPHGTVKCTANGVGGPNCSNTSGTTRAGSVATYIRNNIGTLVGAGYTATVTNTTTVNVTAPAAGASYNGTQVVVSVNNLATSQAAPILLAGGADAAPAALGLTITALGDQSVDWYGYSGPSTTQSPYNVQKVTRHYGFGTGPTTTNCATGQPCVALIGSDGNTYPLTNVGWLDGTITGTVSTSANGHNLPSCAVSQQSLYGGSTTQCGQLLIRTAAGKTSVDTVTVTVGGKTPTVLSAGQTIQSAIDAAKPGDMIIVPAGTYNEMVVMWKPVRLQGVGAASSVIDANTQPAGNLLTPWRQKIVCLFGLTIDGRPRAVSDQACDSGLTDALVGDTARNFATMTVDRLPFEATLGWDATLNGNLAEQLSEPSLLGAYEGAAITVLGKGVKFPVGTALGDAFGATTGAAFPTSTTLLTAADCGGAYPTNYYCNPSSIDGLALRDSSQGGGGVFVHAYAHNLQIANNRVHNNTGTMSGGITIGAGEHPDVELANSATVLNYPESCEISNVTNLALPFCFNMRLNIHNNAVVGNSSMGDELFSSTPAGAGGVSINTGADYYKFTNNWVCGNISTGDGGGFSHIGFTKNGDIENNTIIFNQSTNPTIATNGGGLLLMGAPDADPTTCGVTTDQDCLPPPGSVSPSDGTGQGLTINANLILGNAADSGSGGGVRMQGVNGTDVLNFLNGATACAADLGTGAGHHCYWNSVNMTNNIIVNNVAGWDGAGVSMVDALAVNIVNNTIAANDSTASSGTLFQTLFAPLASSTPVAKTTCGATDGQSCPQVSGLVSVENSPVLVANVNQTAGTKNCAQGHGTSASACFGTTAVVNSQPVDVPGHSIPLMFNDAIWQNRSFYLGVGGFGPAPSGQNQQHLVAIYNANQVTDPTGNYATTTGTGSPVGTQGTTGACPSGSTYWEIGYRGDPQAVSHATSGFAPSNSLLSSGIYGGSSNQTGSPAFASQYCNGSRTPPEAASALGIPADWAVPPGTNETNAFPTLVFNLTPSAVVDEGNNWVNLRWGPLSLYPVTGTAPYTGTKPLADYTPQGTSSAINTGTASVTVVTGNSSVTVNAPKTDFFGSTRPMGGGYEIGAIEVAGTGGGGGGGSLSVTKVDDHGGSSITSTSGTLGTGSTITYTMVVTNTGTTAVTGATLTDTLPAIAGVGLLTISTGTGGWSCLATAGSTCAATASTSSTTRSGTMTLAAGGKATYTLRGSLSPLAPVAILLANASSTSNKVTVTAGAVTSTATDTTNFAKISSISPTSFARPASGSANVPVTIAGTGLGGATAVTMSGSGVTCSGAAANTAGTSVTATCAISSTATRSPRTVTVATPAGSSIGAVFFTVN